MAKWMGKAVKHPGAFTAKAKRRGLTVQQFANKVRAHPERYDARTRRQANYAHTAKAIARKKKR